jgi:serine protease Do
MTIIMNFRTKKNNLTTATTLRILPNRVVGIFAFLMLAAVCFFISANAAFAQRAALPDFSDLVEKEAAAVVNVSTKARPTTAMRGAPSDDEQMEFFRRFMPPEMFPQQPQTPRRNPRDQRERAPAPNEQPLREVGQGSGFIISADGFIITNRHVVTLMQPDPKNPRQAIAVLADEVTVTLNDKREFKAKVVGTDARTDIAVLKVEATGLPKVSIGNSEKVRVGEWVLAIGSPFGFESTVTAGIVSAKSRDTPTDLVPFIQTDAAVNPGNSGGPLFNTKGEVIGVNSQIFTGTGGYLGISFAIPSNTAMDVANQLMKNGKVQRSRIGVSLAPAPISEELAEALGLPKKDPGVMVDAVEEGGPADKAGVKARDVIQKVDGKVVRVNVDIQRLIFPKAPGSKVALTVWRDGKVKELTANVVELIETGDAAPRAATPKSTDKVEKDKPNRLGLIVEEVDADDKKAMSITDGVIISDATGAAARAGLRAGDAILVINNTEITSVKQFNELVTKLDEKRPVALLVKRDETPARFITLRMDPAK